jgi:hypothetical protein
MQPSLLFFLLLLIIVLGVLWVVRRESNTRKRLVSFVKGHGWTIQTNPKNKRAYHICQQTGELAWEMNIFRTADKQIPLTQWSSRKAALKDSPVVLGPHIAGMVYETGSQKAINQMTQQLIFDSSKVDSSQNYAPEGWQRMGVATDGLGPQKVGTPAFQELFTVWSRSIFSARQVLHPEVERKLRDWPLQMSLTEGPLIQVNEDGVCIRVQNDRAYWKPDMLKYIVDLGEEICRAVSAYS